MKQLKKVQRNELMMQPTYHASIFIVPEVLKTSRSKNCGMKFMIDTILQRCNYDRRDNAVGATCATERPQIMDKTSI